MAPNSDYYHDDDGPICRVCRGDGRVSERIPASDAIADAETLRAVASMPYCKADALIRDAVEEAECEMALLAKFPHLRAWLIHYCARAAFRAVPGLRGE